MKKINNKEKWFCDDVLIKMSSKLKTEIKYFKVKRPEGRNEWFQNIYIYK